MAKPNTVKRLTPVAAVDRLEELYAKAASALAEALDAYLSTGAPPSPETRAKFHYPFLRLIYRNEKLPRSPSLRAFARLHAPGAGLHPRMRLYTWSTGLHQSILASEPPTQPS